MRRELPDAREDLTEERSRQVALGELQREVPRVPDQSSQVCRYLNSWKVESIWWDVPVVAAARGSGD